MMLDKRDLAIKFIFENEEIIIKDLKIVVDCHKNALFGANTASLEIFGLSRETQGKLYKEESYNGFPTKNTEAAATGLNQFAGTYRIAILIKDEIIFYGFAYSARTERQGENLITKIEGIAPISPEIVISETIPPNKDVLTSSIASETNSPKKSTRHTVLFGTPNDIMRKYKENHQLMCNDERKKSVDNIYAEGAPQIKIESKDIIDIPVIHGRHTIEFTTRLATNVQICTTIEVNSTFEYLRGKVKVYAIDYKIDTYGDATRKVMGYLL